MHASITGAKHDNTKHKLDASRVSPYPRCASVDDIRVASYIMLGWSDTFSEADAPRFIHTLPLPVDVSRLACLALHTLRVCKCVCFRLFLKYSGGLFQLSGGDDSVSAQS